MISQNFKTSQACDVYYCASEEAKESLPLIAEHTDLKWGQYVSTVADVLHNNLFGVKVHLGINSLNIKRPRMLR